MAEVCKQLYDGVLRTPLMRVEEACCVNLCEKAQADGLPRIRRGDLFILAQQQGMTITECMEFRFDNNLWSVLSRYLLMFRPELATVIFPNTAEIDRHGIDFENVWHDTVARNTFFPARCWQDAAKTYGVTA